MTFEGFELQRAKSWANCSCN